MSRILYVALFTFTLGAACGILLTAMWLMSDDDGRKP